MGPRVRSLLRTPANAALLNAVRGLLALLLLTPFVISPGTFAHFAVSKAIYARVLIETMFVAWVFLAVRFPEFRPHRSRVLLALSFYVMASLLAAVWSVNPDRSFWSTFERMTGVVDLIHWGLFVLVLVSVVRAPATWRTLLNGQLAVALGLSLIALTQAYGYSFIPDVVFKCRVDGTLGNPSFLAPILMISVLIAAGLLGRSWLQSEKLPDYSSDDDGGRAPVPASGQLHWQITAMRTFWLLVITLSLYVLVLTGTRGALIGLVAGALAMPLGLLIWGNRRALKALVLASAGVLTAVGVLFAVDHLVGLGIPDCADQTASNRLTTLVTTTGIQDGPLAIRLAATEAGLQGFLDRPVLGWGPENFGYAFDRHADAWVFRHGGIVLDKAHNQALEELTTKGMVGLAAFGSLWLVLVWAVVRRARPAGEDLLAYAVLGALAAYFVQDLFLFDTPSALLAWLILVGWVAAQEKGPAVAGPAEGGGHERWMLAARLRRAVSPLLAPRWVRYLAAASLVGLLGISLYSFNLQPYLAARAFGQASQPELTTRERLAWSERSFQTFAPMADLPREFAFVELIHLWDSLNAYERRKAREFFAGEAPLALSHDPENAPILMITIWFIQSTSGKPEVLATLGPLLQRLETLAPDRLETHYLLAKQSLLEGDLAGALRISREYQARAPGTEQFFAEIESAAEAELAGTLR